ncbi:MAG: nucleotidyl transferase AbiEii/AbiGii toxin family protein [Pseudomonadales bacterium]
MNERNVAASCRARLLNHARATNQDFNLVLTRYSLERLLYRLAISKHASHFLLKGALLFDLWFDVQHRPTRDADLLGFGSSELGSLEQTFKQICAIKVDDGVVFQADSVHAEEIRSDANYAGVRVTLVSTLDGARSHLQIDVGFGDVVTPAPQQIEYPVLLDDLEAPKLRAYPKYTVIAEKFEAICTLGMGNSRMKDYFDLWILARHSDLSGETLKQAIWATFSRRQTDIPATAPLGLTEEFAADAQKQTQWRAFLRRNDLDGIDLAEVVISLAEFLMPVTEAANADAPFPNDWCAGGPWKSEIDG